MRHRRFGIAFVGLFLAVAILFAVPARQPAWTQEAALRFGAQGPTRVVSEIQIQEPEEQSAAAAGRRAPLQSVALPEDSRAPERAPNRRAGPAPGEAPPRLDVEEAPGASLRRPNLPVVLSEDLVIETLVRPEYPLEARLQGLEAIVVVIALVDEKGRVRSVELESNTGHSMFATTCLDAVRRCHFQPYLRDGVPSPVYAKFRFNFQLL